MKRLLIAFLALASTVYGQGAPVRYLSGSGAPGGTVASVEGTHYVDNSVNPPVVYICTAVNIAAGPNPPAGTQTCTWTAVGSGGSGGVGAGAAPVMGFYGGPTCPVANTAQCFFFPGNTQTCSTATFTNGSPAVSCASRMNNVSASVAANVVTYTFPTTVLSNWTAGDSVTASGFVGGDAFFSQTCTISTVSGQTITCPLVHANASSSTAIGFTNVTNTTKGPFVAGDAGVSKRLFGYATCQADTGISGVALTTSPLTISTFTSSLTVQLSGNAGASSGAGTGCIAWGSLDDAGWAAMDAAMASATQCPFAHLAAANYMVTVPHSVTQPKACTDLPPLVGASNFGALVYFSGFNLEGRETGGTNVFFTPGFPETGGCSNGLSKIACWVVPVEGRIANIHFSGLGNITAPNLPASANIIEVDGPANVENITTTSFGMGSAGSVGLAEYIFVQNQQVNLSAMGDYSFATGATSIITAMRMSVESPKTRAYSIGSLTEYVGYNPLQYDKYHFICYDCWSLNQGQLGSAIALLRVAGGQSVKLYHFRASPFSGGLGINGTIGFQLVGANVKLDVQDSFVDMTAGGTATGTGMIGISCVSACIVISKNNFIKGTAGGSAYADVAGSKFLSEGGNQLGAMAPNAASLMLLSPTDDLSAATGVTPTCTVTGAGATGTCAVTAGGTNEKGTMRISAAGAGPAATGTVTLNFVGTYQFTTTPTCPSMNYANTGTGTWSLTTTTPIVMTTRSSTAPVFNWNQTGALTAAQTYDIDYGCVVR